MDINQEKIIFTNGDSFTFGDELEKPYSSCWPFKLSELTRAQVINFGRSGASNTRIVNTTKNFYNDLEMVGPAGAVIADWALQHNYNSNTAIAVIQWTTYLRIAPEEVKTLPRDISSLPNKDDIDQYLLDKFFVQVRDLQEFFEDRRIPYLMFNAFENEKIIPECNSKFKELVDDKYFIGWPDEAVVNWVYGLPHGPKGHPLEDGHIKIAEIIYDNIRSKLRIS
jgi:hypothetical protein